MKLDKPVHQGMLDASALPLLKIVELTLEVCRGIWVGHVTGQGAV